MTRVEKTQSYIPADIFARYGLIFKILLVTQVVILVKCRQLQREEKITDKNISKQTLSRQMTQNLAA